MSLHQGTEAWQRYTEKILPRHLEGLAVVYVRQSTMQQVLEHQESTRLQYGLVRRAVAWGWPEVRVLVIDEDLATRAPMPRGGRGCSGCWRKWGWIMSGLFWAWRCRAWRVPPTTGINC